MHRDEKKKIMRHALALAENGRYSCSPNPMVGAVICLNNNIIAEGYHVKAGEPHAEIIALNRAKNKTKGATLFVTLEPCSTQGRTPPCTTAIINAGIKKVVIGTIDPNPAHAGNGIKILKNAGVDVELLNCQDCYNLNEKFNKFITQKMPFVNVKWAMTLDGKTASTTGSSNWISSETSRKIVHKLRAEYDAVMTGSNTVIADNPQLNVRLHDNWRQPIKVIIDSLGRIPLNSRIFDSTDNLIIACSNNADKEKIKAIKKTGARILIIPTKSNGKLSLTHLLKKLSEYNISSLLVESGGKLAGALFDEQLIDRVTAFIAPKIIGGKSSFSPILGKGIEKMSDALNLTNIHIEKIENDIMITGNIKPKYSE